MRVSERREESRPQSVFCARCALSECQNFPEVPQRSPFPWIVREPEGPKKDPGKSGLAGQ